MISDETNYSENKVETKTIPKRSIEIEKNRYPYCIVWTPLPLISWIFPFIGHTGICT